MGKLLLLFITISINAQYFENFDSYSLANISDQNPTRWTSWTGEKTVEDCIIIDKPFFSSSQAGYVGGKNGDALFLLGNKTSDVWSIHFKMYVPSNHSAGFEILGESTPNDGFTGEFITYNISFNNNNNTSGIGNLNGSSFTFSHDVWFNVELVIDVSNTNFQMTIDNNLVTPTPINFSEGEILGAINFFRGDYDNKYWIDDIDFFKGLLNTETAHSQNITLFPNPTSGILHIKNITNLEITNIIIKNGVGQKIIESQNVNKIDLSKLSNGIYYVSIENIKGNKTVYKIIKE